MNDRWHVLVTREGRDWLAEVVGIRGGAHTHARTLQGLDKAVREVIILGADLPEDTQEDLQIDYEYQVADEDDTERQHAVETRERALALAKEADQRYARLARQYVAHGLPVRDIAAMLGISHQRVSQLTSPAGGTSQRTAGTTRRTGRPAGV